MPDTYIDRARQALSEELAAVRPGRDALPERLFELYVLLVLSAGVLCSGQDVHDAWAIWKHAEDPAHRSLVSYWQLTEEVQAMADEDGEAIRSAARRLGG